MVIKEKKKEVVGENSIKEENEKYEEKSEKNEEKNEKEGESVSG